MTLPDDPAGRHRAVAGHFSDLVSGVTDWEAAAPVAGWTARDVVGHLVAWLPGFLAAGGDHRWPPGPSVAEDPVAAWVAQVHGVQGLLDDAETASAPFAHPHLPPQPLGRAISQFYTADVFMHSWDLARASGQEPGLDPDLCADLLVGMAAMEQVLRDSGQFGPAVPVPPEAPVQDRLAGFIGRDPAWSPPH